MRIKMAKAITIILATVALVQLSVSAVVTGQESEHTVSGTQPPLFYTCTINRTHSGIHGKSGKPEESARWPGGVLVYDISSELTSQQMEIIKQAQQEISKATRDCITFRQRNSSDVSYVFVQKGTDDDGCSAELGRQDRMSVMILSNICFVWPIIAHELIHALGFNHEHQREDRDDYVTVNFDNIIPGKEYNFDKVIPSETFRVPYDYESVMHYPRWAFAKAEGLETITPKKNVTIGQLSHISYYDSLKLRRMYKCEPSD